MIASFSWRHEEHIFVMLEYVFTVRKTSHVRSGAIFFSFFHFPYVTWEGSAVGIKFVFKRFDMVIMRLFFELSFSQSQIYFFWVTGCWCTYVYHAFPSAITIERTLCLNSTITQESLLCFFLRNIFVMLFDYLWHDLSTAIAYFNGLFVKDFVQFSWMGEVFFYQIQEYFCHVGRYI